ncbi:MAG: sugar phosphate isomerase/epimerase family protein [Akkermansiaceae bacterium]|jgi:sugar phosphate isomerase/epimerase|nr:sugar phosphate isomerase/epimerase [Luteolibacter sp.]
MLAFSTCWNNSRHIDGESMIDEIIDLGFSNIELSHGMTITKLPGIQKAYRAGKFTCSGVHNFFPSPVEVVIDAPDAYEYTSHRAFDRRRAMDMTLKTLEIGAEFNAKYLVLHMGSTPINYRKYTRPLTELVATGRQHDTQFTKLKIDFIKKREKLSALYYQRAIEALEQLAPKAEEYKIKLAIESRSRFEDMPNEREMLKLQKHFKDHPWIGYWHDFGHVQLKHNLGLLDHEEWLKSISPYIIGGHVHDVEWPARDHRTPFTGTLNYPSILSYFPNECPLIWELSPSRQASEIQSSLKIWKEQFPDRS